MKILVPVNNLEDVDPYIKSGAREFYMGFYDPKWVTKFGDYADINRLTGYKERANGYSFQELLTLIPIIQEKGAAVFITFNSSIYSEEQLEYIESYYLEPLREAGIAGAIVSCPELVNLCKKQDLFCVISTIAGAYNTDIITYYKALGADRVILPRDITLSDMKIITDTIPDIEYEAFIMRSGCRFSDSNCLGMHRNEKCSFCQNIKTAKGDIHIKNPDKIKREEAEQNHDIYHHSFHRYSCGLCAIYDFLNTNITTCKVVGRAQDSGEICKDIKIISENIKVAEKCGSREEYLEKMILPENPEIRCNQGLSCYYPEVQK